MTIKFKLVFASLIVLVLFSATLSIAWLGAQKNTEQKHYSKQIAQARFNLEKLESAIAEALLLQGLSMTIQSVQSAQENYQESLSTLSKSNMNSASFREAYVAISGVLEDYFSGIEDLLALEMVASDNEEALVIMFDLQELREEQHQFFDNALQEAEEAETETIEQTRLMLLFTVAITMLGLVLLFWHLYRVVVPPVTGLSQVLEDLQKTGDFSLTAKYWNKDEVGKSVHAFNHMMQAVKTAIDDVNAVMRDLSNENYSSRVESDMQGDLDRLKQGTNLMAKALQQKVLDLQEAMQNEKRAGQVKSQFLANMSHEIRTPMNGVLGMIDLLSRTDLNEQQSRFASTAMSSAKSLLSLINDILDFSKIEAGYLEIEHIDFNLRQLVEETVSSFALVTSEKGVELIADLNGLATDFVEGDPSRFRQVLTNLISNAVKFTEQGEIVVACSNSIETDQSLTVRCEVKDSGIGIPEDKVASLFDSFTQVDASTTRKYGGTGLGLAISKKLCVLMEGDIEVQSNEGEGTIFAFHLKLKKGEEVTLDAPKLDRIKNRLVLIVDDNRTNLEILRGYLEQWGARVIEASSARQTYQLLEQKADKPDLMILDMQMPEEDGASLGKALSQDARFAAIPKIMMTSITQYKEAEFFKEHGFAAYFPKPVASSDLARALAIVLSEESDSKQDSFLTAGKLAQFPNDSVRVSNKNILLVEDNTVNQMVAEALIGPLGYQVEIAENGVIALDKLSNSAARYDLILMDCQMPEMDGYETTEKIRMDKPYSRYKNIPIIAMTANALKGDREKCLNAGMNDYLTKPIEPQNLEDCLNRWLA